MCNPGYRGNKSKRRDIQNPRAKRMNRNRILTNNSFSTHTTDPYKRRKKNRKPTRQRTRYEQNKMETQNMKINI